MLRKNNISDLNSEITFSSFYFIIFATKTGNMDKDTLKQLKQSFYSRHFRHYVNYLSNWDFSNVDFGLNKALNLALTDNNGKSLYGNFFANNNYLANKGIFLKNSISLETVTEQQIWASVEEFFDIINDEALTELNGLNNYIVELFKFIGQDVPQNDGDTKQKSEDTIIRLIVKHFWKENPNRYIEGDFFTPIYCPYDGKILIIEQKDIKKNLQNLNIEEKVKNEINTDESLLIKRPFKNANGIFDKATFDVLINITEERLIDESLDNNFKQVIKYLKAVKQIRNNQAHNIENTVETGAIDVFEFCLFVYIHLVLTLRQSLIRRGGKDYCQIHPIDFYVHIEKPSPNLSIKLFRLDDDKEIEISPITKEDSKLVYSINYYVKYKLVVNNKQEIETEFEYKDYSPHAIIPDMGAPKIRRGDEDSPQDNPIRFVELLKEVTRTGNNVEDIRETNRAILEFLKAVARNFFLFAMFVILAVLLYFAIRPSHKDDQNILIIDKIADTYISTGDSLLQIGVNQHDIVKCEQAGKAYRAAITKLRDLAEQMDYNSSIALCHMYLSGKGCYDLDSALYFAQEREIRATKEGQGLYAYILIKRGEYDAAGREVSRAIDPDEPYICLTRALYKIYDATNNVSSLQTSKQLCESAYQSLDYINNDDARYEKAILSLWGVRNREDTEFLFHPYFGKSYNALLQLSNSYPISLLSLGDIHNLMGDTSGGLDYHCAAFYCGIQQKAAVSINLSMLLNAETFKLTERGIAMKEKMTGMANVIGGVGGLLSDYIHYMEDNKYDWAVKTADSLYVLTHEKRSQNIYMNDTAYISSIQITSRLMTGKAEDFSKAVHLAMIRDNCSDSIAVSDYLKGVCLAKGYGCMKDLKKSDELILASAQRGTYTESLATNILRNPPLHGEDIIPSKLLNHYFNPVLLKKSPKLVSAIGTVFFIADIKYSKEYDISSKLLPYFPQLWSLMNSAFNSFRDKVDNYKIKRTFNEDEKEFEEINDYICLAMRDGLSYIAKNGCLQFYSFASAAMYQLNENIKVYQKFSIDIPKIPEDKEKKVNNKNISLSDINQFTMYNIYNNPLPTYPVYAY